MKTMSIPTQCSAQSLTFNNMAYIVYIESTGCPYDSVSQIMIVSLKDVRTYNIYTVGLCTHVNGCLHMLINTQSLCLHLNLIFLSWQMENLCPSLMHHKNGGPNILAYDTNLLFLITVC